MPRRRSRKPHSGRKTRRRTYRKRTYRKNTGRHTKKAKPKHKLRKRKRTRKYVKQMGSSVFVAGGGGRGGGGSKSTTAAERALALFRSYWGQGESAYGLEAAPPPERSPRVQLLVTSGVTTEVRYSLKFKNEETTMDVNLSWDGCLQIPHVIRKMYPDMQLHLPTDMIQQLYIAASVSEHTAALKKYWDTLLTTYPDFNPITFIQNLEKQLEKHDLQLRVTFEKLDQMDPAVGATAAAKNSAAYPAATAAPGSSFSRRDLPTIDEEKVTQK